MAVPESTVQRDELAISHIGLVSRLAQSVGRRLPPSFALEDLEGEGRIALLRAAEAFDPARGVPFPLYARSAVRGAMIESVRRRRWIAGTCQPLADAPEPCELPALEALIDRAELFERFLRAVDELPTRQRKIVQAIQGDHSVSEIASQLGVSLATVAVDRAAAIAAIRARLAGDPAPPRRLMVVATKVRPIKTDLAAAAAAALAAKQADEVDELGALEKEFAPLRPKLARMELLRGVVRARYDSAAATESFEATGAKFVVMVGPRANASIIDYPKLVKAIGAKLFCAIAKTTLKALEEHVPPSVRAEVVTVEASGARSLKTFERGTPEMPKAA